MFHMRHFSLIVGGATNGVAEGTAEEGVSSKELDDNIDGGEDNEAVTGCVEEDEGTGYASTEIVDLSEPASLTPR